jgi:hypothetical protein
LIHAPGRKQRDFVSRNARLASFLQGALCSRSGIEYSRDRFHKSPRYVSFDGKPTGMI